MSKRPQAPALARGNGAGQASASPAQEPIPLPNPYSGPRAETVAAEIARLSKMTVAELREKHRELYGTETRSKHKTQLFRRLAWRVQELEWGGLSERALRRIEELADDRDARFLPPRVPKGGGNGNGHREVVAFIPRASGDAPLAPGTVLTREYRGQQHRVVVMEGGRFEYAGRFFKSLSGIAREITGVAWSGPLFFGLRQRPLRKEASHE